jgi:hypothetical protein
VGLAKPSDLPDVFIKIDDIQAAMTGLSAVDSVDGLPILIEVASEQLVAVTWIDSWVSGATWEPRGEPDLDFGTVISVGFLVWFTDQWVVVASSLSEDQQGGVQRIPRSTIASLVILKDDAMIERPKQ